MERGILFRVKDNLGQAIPVSNINKDHAAMVSPAGDPTG